MKTRHSSATKKMANHGLKPIGGLKEVRLANNPGEENHRRDQEETYILVEHGLVIDKEKAQ